MKKTLGDDCDCASPTHRRLNSAGPEPGWQCRSPAPSNPLLSYTFFSLLLCISIQTPTCQLLVIEHTAPWCITWAIDPARRIITADPDLHNFHLLACLLGDGRFPWCSLKKSTLYSYPVRSLPGSFGWRMSMDIPSQEKCLGLLRSCELSGRLFAVLSENFCTHGWTRLDPEVKKKGKKKIRVAVDVGHSESDYLFIFYSR